MQGDQGSCVSVSGIEGFTTKAGARAPDLEANRMDLVYRVGNDREASGWVFVVGKGFTFSTGLRGGR